jgi:hypothetical protein
MRGLLHLLFSQPFEKSRLAEGLPEDRLDRGLPE